MLNDLRNFLALSYDQLEQLNLKAKEQRKNRVAPHKIQEERLKYLTDEKRIKAVTVMFSDLEGRLHMLDYDKKFLLKSWDNLTFDGSSIRGFTAQRESDLRLGIDWARILLGVRPTIFGPGKVLVFGEVIDKGGTAVRRRHPRHPQDCMPTSMYKDEGYTLNAANEIEGFLFNGVDAERRYHETGKFEYVNTGGYYHSLPGDPLRTFIDTTRRSAARHGLPERERPSGSGAFAVRNQLRVRRSRGCSRPDPDLQAGLPPGRNPHGPDRQLPAETGGGRERQRHAHQRVHQQRRQEPVLGPQGRGETEQAGLVVRGPHSHARQRHLPAAQPQRERVSPARSALRSAQPDQSFGHRIAAR